MNVMPDLGRRLRDHFRQEAPERAPDRVLRAALAAIETTPQRRISAPWTISHMFGPVRTIALAAAILALILAPISLLPRDSGPGCDIPIAQRPTPHGLPIGRAPSEWHHRHHRRRRHGGGHRRWRSR